MKKIITAWLLIAALFTMPTTAYAQNQTTGSMTLTYEYAAPPIVTSSYIVNIPAYVNINEMDVVPITASKNDIESGKKIVIRVDWDKTSDNPSNLFLNIYKNKGESDEEFLVCRIHTYINSSLTTLIGLDGGGSDMPHAARVAEFNAGSLTPTQWGYLHFKPATTYLTTGRSSGTYTGVLYFKITVENM